MLTGVFLFLFFCFFKSKRNGNVMSQGWGACGFFCFVISWSCSAPIVRYQSSVSHYSCVAFYIQQCIQLYAAWIVCVAHCWVWMLWHIRQLVIGVSIMVRFLQTAAFTVTHRNRRWNTMFSLSLSVGLEEVCRISLPMASLRTWMWGFISTGRHFGPWQQSCREQ